MAAEFLPYNYVSEGTTSKFDNTSSRDSGIKVKFPYRNYVNQSPVGTYVLSGQAQIVGKTFSPNGNLVHALKFFGITGMKASMCTFNGNGGISIGTNYGVIADYSSFLQFINCKGSANRHGMVFHDCADITVKNFRSAQCESAVQVRPGCQRVSLIDVGPDDVTFGSTQWPGVVTNCSLSKSVLQKVEMQGSVNNCIISECRFDSVCNLCQLYLGPTSILAPNNITFEDCEQLDLRYYTYNPYTMQVMTGIPFAGYSIYTNGVSWVPLQS